MLRHDRTDLSSIIASFTMSLRRAISDPVLHRDVPLSHCRQQDFSSFAVHPHHARIASRSRSFLNPSSWRLTLSGCFDVMSLSARIMRSSTSLPASVIMRLTAGVGDALIPYGLRTHVKTNQFCNVFHLLVEREFHCAEYARNHLLTDEIMIMEYPPEFGVIAFRGGFGNVTEGVPPSVAIRYLILMQRCQPPVWYDRNYPYVLSLFHLYLSAESGREDVGERSSHIKESPTYGWFRCPHYL